MDQNSRESIQLSLRDPIDELGLSIRSYNALRRAGIRTVEDLIQVIDAECLPDIRNVGKKAINEIEGCLARVELVAPSQPLDQLSDIESDVTTTQRDVHKAERVVVRPILPKKVVDWQARLVRKEIAAGLLHIQAKTAGHPLAYWLEAIDSVDRSQAYEMMASILGGSLNLCEELSLLFDEFPRGYADNYITVLLSRYGFETRTLEEIGMEIGVTRERVRQISDKSEGTIGRVARSAIRAKSFSDSEEQSPLLRMQSALLFAEDMGMSITFEQWKQSLQASGLVGSWVSHEYVLIDPIEAMIAVCNLLADRKIPELRIPDNDPPPISWTWS